MAPTRAARGRSGVSPRATATGTTSWASAGTGSGTLSTAQAYQLGALDGRAVATVTGPVRATLTAVGEHTGLRSLRVDAGGATYVVEYRAAVGADAWLGANWRGLRPGVLVRRSDPDGGGQTLLLDGTPSRAAGFDTDWEEPVPPGAALTAAGGRLVVRVEAETPPRRTCPSRSTGCRRRPASPASARGSRARGRAGWCARRSRGPATPPRR